MSPLTTLSSHSLLYHMSLPPEIWHTQVLPLCSPLRLLCLAATSHHHRQLVSDYVQRLLRMRERAQPPLHSTWRRHVARHLLAASLALDWDSEPRHLHVRPQWTASLVCEITPALVEFLGGARQVRFWLVESDHAGQHGPYLLLPLLRETRDSSVVSLLSTCNALPLLELPGSTFSHHPIMGPMECDDLGEIFDAETSRWRRMVMYLVLTLTPKNTVAAVAVDEYLRTAPQRPYKESKHMWTSLAILSGCVETLQAIWRWVEPTCPLTLATWNEGDIHMALEASAEMTAFLTRRFVWTTDLALWTMEALEPRVRDHAWPYLLSLGPDVLMPLVAVVLYRHREPLNRRQRPSESSAPLTVQDKELVGRLVSSALLTTESVGAYWVPIFSHFVSRYRNREQAEKAMRKCTCRAHVLFRELGAAFEGMFEGVVLMETPASRQQCLTLLRRVNSEHLFRGNVADGRPYEDEDYEEEQRPVYPRRRRPVRLEAPPNGAEGAIDVMEEDGADGDVALATQEDLMLLGATDDDDGM